MISLNNKRYYQFFNILIKIKTKMLALKNLKL